MYQKHSQTSKEAYETLNNRRGLSEQVFEQIETMGVRGVTAGWIAMQLKMQTGTVSARLIELEREGRIIRLKKKGINPSGKKAQIYANARYLKNGFFNRQDILTPKSDKQNQPFQSKPNQESLTKALELLNQVDSWVMTGFHILPESNLHKEIKRFLEENPSG